MLSQSVNIFEVGPRDGLQNECKILTLQDKIKFVESLIQAGLRDLELGAFVRPDQVPQMADTDRLYASIQKEKLKIKNARAWALVPNRIGLERAIQVGTTHIAVFGAATESFVLENIGMTIKDSLAEFREVIKEGRAQLGSTFHVRAYVSTAFGCPFEGKVSPTQALKVIEKFYDMNVDQISIGDTIGVATPKDVEKLIRPALKLLGTKKTAVHFHDTRGTALVNTLKSLEMGVRVVDSSAGGLGGCPFAPGASGNLATEDLVYMLNGMGIKTGIDLNLLCEASQRVMKKLNKTPPSRYLQCYLSQRRL